MLAVIAQAPPRDFIYRIFPTSKGAVLEKGRPISREQRAASSFFPVPGDWVGAALLVPKNTKPQTHLLRLCERASSVSRASPSLADCVHRQSCVSSWCLSSLGDASGKGKEQGVSDEKIREKRKAHRQGGEKARKRATEEGKWQKNMNNSQHTGQGKVAHEPQISEDQLASHDTINCRGKTRIREPLIKTPCDELVSCLVRCFRLFPSKVSS